MIVNAARDRAKQKEKRVRGSRACCISFLLALVVWIFPQGFKVNAALSGSRVHAKLEAERLPRSRSTSWRAAPQCVGQLARRQQQSRRMPMGMSGARELAELCSASNGNSYHQDL